MTLPVRLTPAAEQDILLAQRWYLAEEPRVLASSTNHEIHTMVATANLNRIQQ